MAFNHGRRTHFALDLPDTSGPSDASALFRSISGLEGTAARPMTTTFGAAAHRRQVLGLRDAGPISLGGLFQQTAGTKVHGRNTRIITDQYPLTGYLRNCTVRRSVQLPDTTTFGESFRRRQVVGLMDGGMSFGGLFDPAAGAADAVFSGNLATATPLLVSAAPNGFAIGQIVDLGQFVVARYAVEDQLEDVVPISADLESDDRIDLGVSLHDLTAETGTVNGTSVDELAATALGWVAHLHVSAYSGGGSVTIKLQDSPDDGVWSDLAGGGFTAVTAVGKQRLEGGATAAVARYVRMIVSAFSATSITFVVVFARRGATYGTAGTVRSILGLYGAAATSSFRLGPDGSDAGKPRFTGECRLESYEHSFPHDDNVSFQATLAIDGAVTRDTF